MAQEEDEPPGGGAAHRIQGGDEGGSSQGRDMRDPEEPGGIQATATMVAHGGADGGRSHGGGMATYSKGPTNRGGAGGGGARERWRWAMVRIRSPG